MAKKAIHHLHAHAKKALHHAKKAVSHHEGSAEDNRDDIIQARRHGMTLRQWEGSPMDRRRDVRAAVVKAVAHAKTKGR